MARARTVSVWGPAAGALIRAKSGEPADNDDERALRVATLVHMNMGRGADTSVAVGLIKAVARDGLAKVAETCTAEKK